MTYKWVPITGNFQITDKSITFKGGHLPYKNEKGEDLIGTAAGSIISNQLFNQGNITAEIEFTKVDEKSSCEIIFYYEPETGNFLSAGISPQPAMFHIRSFINTKWTNYTFNGDHKNLKPETPYNLRVQLVGSKVSLFIDEVEVLSYLLPTPLKQSQVGLFLFSNSDVVIKNYKVNSEKPKAFVIMEFTDQFNDLYDEVIKSVCEDEFNLNVIRADEIFGPGIIISDITKQINEATIIIAEITPVNANVFYEVGYAHALKKPTILLAQKSTKLPFDVSPFRTLFYENTIAGKKKVQQGLRKHLTSILKQ